ncbi:MAG: hypothetical protein QG596_24 [Actinomycetota bacterium]|jgi:hypothetical protein|nr:hypothetical protein [Actinomycetota bacterium]
MSTPTKLFLFGISLMLIFGFSFFAGKALIPEETVSTWTREAEDSADDHGDSGGHEADAGHRPASATPEPVSGLSIEQDGYRMTAVKAPTSVVGGGELSFQILDPAGAPLTDFTTSHEKDLHLIVVGSDGSGFRHVHPRLDRRSGTWTLPWTWTDGGSYRVFADFVPAGSNDAASLTLSRSVQVTGSFSPVVPVLSRTDRVGGYKVRLSGELEAGESRDLTAKITEDGAPVTDLQPYLGSFGHLVALREGDLAYLHVHAGADHESVQEQPSDGHGHGTHSAGPDIDFMTAAPTPGRYLMYLDFKVDGDVHTAEFVLEAK